MSRTHLLFACRARAALLLLLLASCSDQPVVEPRGADGAVAIRADVSGTAIAAVVVEVSAPDIPTTLVFNIPVANGVASGTITVPAGSNRTIAMRAFDASGVQTHAGSITLTIQSGTNPATSIVLTPLTGDVPLQATLGDYTITVSPPSSTLARGGTVHLTAAIKDTNGNPMTGTVAWATDNPGVAAVDDAGVVTATGVGTTTIAATFHGASGTAAISVTP